MEEKDSGNNASCIGGCSQRKTQDNSSTTSDTKVVFTTARKKDAILKIRNMSTVIPSGSVQIRFDIFFR